MAEMFKQAEEALLDPKLRKKFEAEAEEAKQRDLEDRIEELERVYTGNSGRTEHETPCGE